MRTLTITPQGRQELVESAKHHPKAYVREKVKALLLVDKGIPAAAVAREYLIPARAADTVYGWMDRYEAEGVAGLVVRAGRGRKPAFSPSAPKRRQRQRRVARHRTP